MSADAAGREKSSSMTVNAGSAMTMSLSSLVGHAVVITGHPVWCGGHTTALLPSWWAVASIVCLRPCPLPCLLPYSRPAIAHQCRPAPGGIVLPRARVRYRVRFRAESLCRPANVVHIKAVVDDFLYSWCGCGILSRWRASSVPIQSLRWGLTVCFPRKLPGALIFF